MNKDYEAAIKQAKTNFADLKECGDEALGGTWEDFEHGIFTPEEISAIMNVQSRHGFLLQRKLLIAI